MAEWLQYFGTLFDFQFALAVVIRVTYRCRVGVGGFLKYKQTSLIVFYRLKWLSSAM